MPTLYLHVGHGKTGTSWIQSVLRLSSTELKKHGIIYAIGQDHKVLDPNKITSGNAVSILGSRQSFESILENCHSTDNDSLLFSSENLFLHFVSSNAEAFIDEVALKNGFDRVEILLFIRNPVSHAVSFWQQQIKRGGGYNISLDSFNQFENDLRYKIFSLVEQFLEKAKKCELINLTVLNYSNCKDNLINYLASWLKVPVEILTIPSGKRVNRSMTYAELMLQKELNRILGPSGRLISDPLCEKLTEIEPDITIPHLSVQNEMWAKIQPIVERLNRILPVEHRYLFDIQNPEPLPEVLTFTHQQIEIVAESLGYEILRLRKQLENAKETISNVRNKLIVRNKNYQELQRQIGESKEMVSSLKSSCDEKWKQINDLNIQLKHHKTELLMIKKSFAYKLSKVLLILLLVFRPSRLIRVIRERLFIFRNTRLIKQSGLFNENYYLEKNPDVKKSDMSAIKHYLIFGGLEGRKPSEKFDSAFYLEQYQDEKASGMNPLVHYLRFGKAEGRQIRRK